MKKRFLDKFIIIGTLLCSALGIMSVGFASWVISAGNEDSISGRFEVDSTDFRMAGVDVSLDSSSPNFTMGVYFFEYDNKNYSTADVIYNVDINQSELDKNYVDDGVLKISCTVYLVSGKEFSDAVEGASVSTQTGEAWGSYADVANFENTTTKNISASFSFDTNVDTNSSAIIHRRLKITFNNKLCYKYSANVLETKIGLRFEGVDDQ